MSSPDYPADPAYNLNNELAKERTRAAADRTLMAWLRTALSLISFGFGLPTIVGTVSTAQVNYLASALGLSFISIGLYAMFAALKEHRRVLQRIQSNHYLYQSSQIAENIGQALIIVGVVSFLGVFIKALGL